MKANEALEVLVRAAVIGQSKGAFSLAEAKIVAEAVETFSKKPEEPKAEVVEGDKAPLAAKADESVPAEAQA